MEKPTDNKIRCIPLQEYQDLVKRAESSTIYLAQYKPYFETEESSYVTLSTHRTEVGAEKAIALHKIAIKQEYEKTFDAEFCKKHPYTESRDWCVIVSKLEE